MRASHAALATTVAALAILLGACASELAAPSSADVFMVHCASCHGPQGEGDGPVAATMRMPAPNLRTLSQRNGGTFPSDAVASYIDGRNLPAAHGERQMPVWGQVFDATPRIVPGAEPAPARIEHIMDYLQQLQY